MKIIIGSDHTALEMRQAIIDFLTEKGHEVVDLGPKTADAVDYPDFGFKVGEAVNENDNSLGIVICGSGIGISIAANKVKNIRAALCHEKEAAELARKHNNANVLALGARFIAVQKALGIVETFLNTEFEGDRHEQRVRKLCDYSG